MSTTLENLTENLTTEVNDQVILNLIDSGFSPAEAYEAGTAKFDFIEELQLHGVDLVDLDPIFYEVNLDNVPWDKLPF